MSKSFEDLGLSPAILNVLRYKGFEEPTPIQEKTIPALLTGNQDIVGQAQTGTGKTAAFGLPMIELLPERSKTVQALILTPTRELAIQVAEEIHSLKGGKKLEIVPIYGGQSIDLQLRRLKKGVDIVVGTPGRVLDHLKRRTLKLDNISFLVLDEADEMLNMGFIEDVEKIIQSGASDKRTLLFSATMPKEIIRIARKYMGDYEVIKVSPGQITVDQTDQIYFEVTASDKFEALCRIIDIEEEFYGLVFCRTKLDVDAVAHRLIERGYDADGLHGDMSQAQRERILDKFKKRLIHIMVATDVAARGIDVQDLSHVINYTLPQNPESYIHRIGRTGRAGKEGIAITFITPAEYRKLKYISRETKTDIRKGRLPGVKDVIKMKKRRIKADLQEIVQAEPGREFYTMSKDLLSFYNPGDILAAVLQYAFQDELSPKSYKQIEDAIVDMKGKTRLFVTEGKQDGMTRSKLIQFIRTKTNIEAKRIKDIEILDRFSFVTLPFHEAEKLLSHFRKKSKRRSGPMIKKAKESKR